ncbi:MAG: serine/threonine-protein kinase [Bryobacteraceae bacterium]
MTEEHWRQLSEKLNEALESANPQAFAAEDAELSRLIDAHSRSERWLEPPARDALVGQTILGRYFLSGILGRGGAGTVYLASDTQVHGRQVVVKLLHDYWVSESWMRQKFRDESAALAKLDHPGIVSVLDAGESEDGRLYLVMPYRHGRTLRQALAEGGIDASAAAEWIREIGEAVTYAHDRGILHRDLKPENILLVARGERECPMLLDFGIAHAGDPANPSRTTSHLMGSAFYMAPEHLLGRPERASDLYSLAIVSWELLTGRHPFEAESPFALPDLQRKGVGDLFFRLRPDLNLEVGKLLGRGLDFDPKRRPMPAQAFSADLADSVSAAAAGPRLARIWAVRRSRRWAIGTGGLMVAAAATGSLYIRDLIQPLTADERLIRFRGGVRAEDSGFQRAMDMYGEFLVEPGKPEIRISRYFSKSQGLAMRPLIPSQKRAALRGGWRMKAALRPESGRVGMLLDVGNLAPRFDLSLEIANGGILLMTPLEVRSGASGPSKMLDPVPDTGLIDIEMEYEPSTKQASVRAGGRLMIPNYPGHDQYRENVGFSLYLEIGKQAEARSLIGDASFEILG